MINKVFPKEEGTFKVYNKRNNYIEKLFYLIVLSIVVFLAQNSYLVSNIRMLYLSASIYIIIFFVSGKEAKLYLLLFILPNNQYISFGDVSIITIAILIFFIQYFIFKGEKIRKELLLLSLAFIIISILFYLYNLNTILNAIKVILYLFFFESVFKVNKDSAREFLIKGILSLSIGIAISSLITLVITSAQYGYRFSLSADQSTNTLAILCGLSIASLLMLLGHINKKYKIFVITLIFFLALIGFATLSRTFLILLITTLFWIICFNMYNKKNISYIVAILFLGMLFLFIYFYNNTFYSLFNTLLERFYDPAGGDISNSRFEIWDKYLSEIVKNAKVLYFGSGKSISNSINIAPHSIWIEQLYHYGIFGNLIIIMLFYSTVNNLSKRYKSNKNQMKFYLMTVLLFAASTFSHSFVGGSMSLLFFMFIMIPWFYPHYANRYIVYNNLK